MNQILRDHNNNSSERNNRRNQQNNRYNNYNNNGYNNNNNNNYGYNNNNYNNNFNNNINGNYFNYKPYQPVVTNNRRNEDYYNKKYNRNKASIETIARVFSILLLLFGMAIIAQSAVALTSSENKPKDIPQVNIEKMGKEVSITVKTSQPTKQIEYWWNDEEKKRLEGSETTTVTQTVDVPNGNNILNIMVEDYYGNKTYYNKQYIYESTDVIKPVVEIAITGVKLRIRASDETKLAYLEYSWNDEEPITVNVTEEQNEIELEIDVKQGQNQLKVTAVDIEGNKTERTEKIIGDTKPEVSLRTEGTNIVVDAKDDEGISKILVTIDGEEKDSGEDPVDQKEVSAKIPVPIGTHEIKATVTNVNGLEATKEITANI
ncbi:MAG: hypothetical protein IKG14_06540 [Clostridia bacterium]|nr:hypothetical protein [Clostridia bacterium]